MEPWAVGAAESHQAFAKHIADLFCEVFLEKTGDEQDIVNKRDVFSFYYALIPVDLWLDPMWLGRQLVKNNVLGPVRGVKKRRKAADEDAEFADIFAKESSLRCRGKGLDTSLKNLRIRDRIVGHRLITSPSQLNLSQSGLALQTILLDRKVPLDPGFLEPRIKAAHGAIQLFHLVGGLDASKAVGLTFRDLVAARLGGDSAIDLEELKGRLFNKPLVIFNGEQLVKYCRSTYLPVRVLRDSAGSLVLQFDTYGVILDMERSRREGNHIFLAFVRAPLEENVVCSVSSIHSDGTDLLHDLTSSSSSQHPQTGETTTSPADEVLMDVLVPHGYENDILHAERQNMLTIILRRTTPLPAPRTGLVPRPLGKRAQPL
eukprot:TRINITY_DN14926_c0_g1_i1.p1 TRINITY_DN14926_c0_g1~~TRINITY_DN14926_c0_g1_i1.p1  ORF type:complete len:383 (-),score=53.90 TRINITY_DN14926_c0_g1_i1:62-1183(-)